MLRLYGRLVCTRLLCHKLVCIFVFVIREASCACGAYCVVVYILQAVVRTTATAIRTQRACSIALCFYIVYLFAGARSAGSPGRPTAATQPHKNKNEQARERERARARERERGAMPTVALMNEHACKHIRDVQRSLYTVGVISKFIARSRALLKQLMCRAGIEADAIYPIDICSIVILIWHTHAAKI